MHGLPQGDFSSFFVPITKALRGQANLLVPACFSGPEPVRTAAYQLLRTTRDLELMALLSGDMPPGIPVDLGQLVWQLGRAVSEICRFRELCPAVQLPREALPVLAPIVPMAEVFLRLLYNAMTRPAERPGIHICCRVQGPWALVILRDCGTEPDLVKKSLQNIFPAGQEIGPFLAGQLTRRIGGSCWELIRPGSHLTALALPLRPELSPAPAPDAAFWLRDRFSPVFVQLAGAVVLPD